MRQLPRSQALTIWCWLSLGVGTVGCGITGMGAVALGEALEKNTTLRTLALSGNDLRDLGAYAFSDVVCYNRSLRRLSLANCNIGRAGGAILLLAVRVHAGLHSRPLLTQVAAGGRRW